MIKERVGWGYDREILPGMIVNYSAWCLSCDEPIFGALKKMRASREAEKEAEELHPGHEIRIRGYNIRRLLEIWEVQVIGRD